MRRSAVTERPITVTADNAEEVARVFKAFVKPFDECDIKLKPAMVKGNRCLALAYIDARLVCDKLDEVVGFNNWKDEFTLLPGGSVECRLSVRVAGEWITKCDVGSESEQPDEGDRMKAAYSDALKRAAVKFGIGRFLYRRPQQWMDYDPVKKQIVRPEAGKRAQPAPQPNADAPKPAPQDNPLVAEYRRRAGACGDRDALTKLYREFEADKNIADGVRPAIVAVFKDAGKKFAPAPAN